MIRVRSALTALVVEGLCAWGLVKLVAVPWWWSILLALPIATVLLLLLNTPPGVEPAWAPPPEPPTAASHLDASTFASRLADAANDPGRYQNRVRPRLASLALAELRKRPQLADLPDLADPRAREALGPRWHTLLTDPKAELPEPGVVLALLTYLEEQ